MAISTVAIHIFGDVPSSPLVGIVQDHINSWRKTTLILTSILFLAAAIWFIGKINLNSFYSNDESFLVQIKLFVANLCFCKGYS
jgi:biotin transporter BioY